MEPRLENRILACPTLPSVPAVALEILDLCRREEVDLRDVAACLSRDPALAAKVLRVANSVATSARGGVSTLGHAVALLGTNAVLTLALSFSLVRDRRSGDAGLDLAAFWRRALHAATAARAVAPACGADPEVAFVAGLVQDLGVLALHEALRAEYGAVLEGAGDAHARLAPAERERLGTDHAEVGALLARTWNLPADLQAALAQHHAAVPPPDATPLVRCASLARAVAEVFERGAPDGDVAAAVAEACGAHGLAPAAVAAALERVGREVKALAAALEVELPGPEEAQRVLDLARETLVLVSFRTARTAHRAEEAVRALASEKRALEESSRRDPVTGVANRAHAEAWLRRAAADALAEGRPLALALCDVDHFKQVNDGHGHAAGDLVLREVALALGGALRATDLVGRWGGDELVAVLPGAAADFATAVAERMRARAAQVRVAVRGGGTVRPTLSIGVAAAPRGATPEELLEAADAALYEAKRAGRDRVCARELASGASHAA